MAFIVILEVDSIRFSRRVMGIYESPQVMNLGGILSLGNTVASIVILHKLLNFF